jgi:hypothetical protein
MGAGSRATDAQVRELRRKLGEEASLQAAAMKAGMDRKTARKYRDGGKLPSESHVPHTWRTRIDPLADVWPQLEELLKREPTLQAKTLVEWLERSYPDQNWRQRRRTIERRVRQWKAKQGPAKEVFFSQMHEPGRLGSSDFTHMDSLGVTIAGQPFSHLLYHFVLTSSNWEHVTICFSESFASLSEGLQNALWELGAVPERHRTDRMTLAVNRDGNLEAFTANYRALISHYGLIAEATNPASGNENGDCEQSHRRFKEALDQELKLRGSRDFRDREEYQQFLRALIARRNLGRSESFQKERARLQPLPRRRLDTLERKRVRVGRGSTIQVKKNAYSVPSRLIGEQVEVHIGAEMIEVRYAGETVLIVERLRGVSNSRIDYRHVIDWLVRKPGAFARYIYREEMYPTTTFRRCYDALVAQDPVRADREYVRVLYLAAKEGESRVEAAVTKLLEQRTPLSEQAVKAEMGSDTPLSEAARVSVPAVDLRLYDALLEGASTASDGNVSEVRIKEEIDEPGCDGGAEALLAGTPLGDSAKPVRSGDAPGDGGIVGLSRVPAGTRAAGVSAAATQPHRTAVEGLPSAAGEELVVAGSETVPDQSGPAVTRAAERGLFGPPRERAGVRPAGLGENACAAGSSPGIGAGRPIGAGDKVQPVGPGTAESQARSEAEGAAAGSVEVGRVANRRPGIRAAEPGGNGVALHTLGGALRTRQCAGHEQPGVLAVGTDLQRPDDDGGRDRPAGSPQRDRGDERTELPCGGRQEARHATAREGEPGEEGRLIANELASGAKMDFLRHDSGVRWSGELPSTSSLPGLPSIANELATGANVDFLRHDSGVRWSGELPSTSSLPGPP